MIITLDSLLTENVSDVPLCIVGAGAVGLTMAIKIARMGKPVLVIEEGAQSLASASPSSPVENDGDLSSFVTGSFNVGLGGSTRSWGGQMLPFDAVDFTARSEVPNSGWPIDHQDLHAWYTEAEQMLGVDYASFDESVYPEQLEQPGPSSDLRLGFSKWCPESDFSTLFADEISQSTCLKIVLGAKVESISRDAKQRSLKLEIVTEFGERRSLPVASLVLAGGGLANYKILANSPKMAAALPALGCYYHDHIGFYGARLTPRNTQRFNDLFTTKLVRGERCVPKIQRNSQTHLHSLNVNATIEAQVKQRSALEGLKIIRKILRGKESLRTLFPALLTLLFNLPAAIKAGYQYLILRRIAFPQQAEFFLVANCESVPIRESKIAIDAGANKQAIATWLVDDRSRDAMRGFYQSVKYYLENNQIADVEIKPSLMANDRTWVEGAYSLYHHMGATRMGTSVESSVVDRHCQVHHEPNLYVAGCSVLPTGSCSNPTFTAIALGLRLANRLATQAQ